MGQLTSCQFGGQRHCGSGYNDFILSRHFTRPRDKRIIWLYGQECIKVGYVFAKFGDHRHSDSGDIMILISHIISQDHLIKGPYDFTGWIPSR